MKLILITALIAACHTAKLDRTYLPPPSAATAGGNHNSLQAPLIKTSENQVAPSDAPLGSYTNEYQGVVVDAAAPGTRASSENDLTGLGAPRPSYGSLDSKVGEAAFRGSLFQGQGNAGPSDLKLERPQANKDRNSNILTYSNDVNPDAYSYGFETDNGIAVGENGIAANGIQAEGGYSYQGDDGQTYKVTYVADEKGYRPQGAHLPTPPPIPAEILKSLQQNAQEEAAGIVDDGSYNAQKYNGDYTHHADNSHNGAQLSQFGKRPESDTSASGSFINQNNQALTDRFGSQATEGQLNEGNQFQLNHQHHGLQGFSGFQGSQSQGVSGQSNSQTSQFGLTNHFNNHASQFGDQTQSTRPSGSQLETQVQYSQSSGKKFGSQVQSTQPSGSRFGAQAQYAQSSGSPGTQFGSHVQSTQPSGSQFGNQAQSTLPSESQFGAQAQSSQQFGAHAHSTNPFRPQFGNQPQLGFQSNIQTQPQPEGLQPTDAAASSSFSQSSVTPSPVSGNQFNGLNKPVNAFSSNNKFGASSNINRFSQTSNQFAANNEYLPPSNDIGSKPHFGVANTFNNGQNQNRPSQSINTQTQGFSQNSAFATSLKPNNFQSQTQSRPSQFTDNFQTSQNQQFNLQSTPSQPSQSSQSIPNLKPTSIPDTELTTPLEPNEVSTSASQSEYNSQTSTDLGSSTPSFVSSSTDLGGSTSSFGGSANFGSSSPNFGSSFPNFGGSKPSSGSSISSFDGFNKQPSNQFGQSQQFNTQENFGSNTQTFPSTASTSRPQPSQFGGSINKQSNNGSPQFQQNSFSQNQFSQKSDDSYYYNQPSKPFKSPPGSRFPSSPSYQSTVGQNSQFVSQQNSFAKVPSSPVSSTFANQFTQNQGSSNNFNGVTQAAISPFPSISPTSSTQLSTTQNNQFGSKPTFSQTSFTQFQPQTNQPSTSLPSRPQFGQKPTISQTTQNGLSNSQNEPTAQNQQYEGTIYEYNKPAETLPPAQSDSDSSQTIQSNVLSSEPEENKQTTSLISPEPAQVSQFGQNSFAQSQQPIINLGMSRPQSGVQSNNVPSRFGQTTQFGSQTSSQQQYSQTTPFAAESSQSNFGQGPVGLAQQPLGTTGSGYLGYPSAQDSKPQFGSNFGEISQFPTVDHSHSNFNPQGLNQNTGFGYKPQNQFSQDSQSAQTAVQNFPSQFSQQNKPSKTDQSNIGSDSQPFSNMAVTSVVPSPPSKQFVPQTSAQAAVSSEPLDFLPLSKPQNQFNRPLSPQPVKSNQLSQFGSQYSSFQGSTAGKGEEFGGPRPPPSYDDKTGYHY